MKRTGISLSLAAAVMACWTVAASAAPFTSGNLVVYRVGVGGTTTLSSAATAVYLDEYTTSGTLVQSVAMPAAASGANYALTASGTATSEGLITLSPDGQYLAVTGYNAAPGFASIASSSTTGATPVTRTVGVITADGTVNTTTTLNWASGNNPRSAVTTNGTDLWLGGAAGGINYATVGGTTLTQVSTALSNIRQLNIFNGQLYGTDKSGSTYSFFSVTPNEPTASGASLAQLPGYPTGGSPYAFFLADLSDSVPGFDTLYVADDGNTVAANGQIQKYCLVGSTWTAKGTVAANGVRGLTASVSGTSVNLFATTGGTIYGFTDTAGYNATINGTLTTITSASANEAFRGIAFAPVTVPEPASLGLLGLGVVGLIGRCKSR